MHLKGLIIVISICLYCQYTHGFSSMADEKIYEYIQAFPYLPIMQDLVWFISSQLNYAQVERAEILMRTLSRRTHLMNFVWTKLCDNVRMTKIASKRGYIAIVVTTGADDAIMLAHDRLLIGRHYSLSLIVYAKLVNDMQPIRELCYRLYRENFVNSVVYFETTKGDILFYGIEIFPHYKIVNKTDYKEAYRQLRKKISAASQDVRGHRFQTPLKQDLPGVFSYNDEMGRKQVYGTTYKILLNFVKSLNGSLVNYDMDSSYGDAINMKEVLNLIRTKDLEISAHAYALYQPDDDVDKSYPLMMVKWCLMVPVRNSVSTFYYTLQPLQPDVWRMVLIVLLALCLKDLLNLITAKHEKCKLFLFVDIFLNNFCHVLNISTPRPIRNRIKACYIAFILHYACIFSFGFFLNACYSSYLGSSLTVSPFRPQINNLQDLIASNQSVMIIDYELEFLLSANYQPLPEFRKLLKSVDSATFYRHQISFNTSYAYFVTDDKWRFLSETQKHLKHKVFKFSDICFGSYSLAYPMQIDSPIWRDLEYFIFRLQSSGMFQKSERKALYYAFKSGLLQPIAESKTYSYVGLDHLQVMFYLLGLIYTIAFGCFLVELWLFYRVQGTCIIKRKY